MSVGQGIQNHVYSVPIQNRFGPLNEWVGYSMGLQDQPNQMEFDQSQSDAAHNKRRRVNTGGTGIDSINFLSLSLDDKLTHMYEKLSNMEVSMPSIANISRIVSSV